MEQIKECEACPQVHKWEPYFKAYQTHFARFRGKKVTMLEVGVQSGGSAQIWRSYFGDGLYYFGVDINPAAQQFENGWATILIGDQADPKFWAKIKNWLPQVDILLDDGGHTMEQQLITFQSMFSHVKQTGVYAVEDLSTSYSPAFGGSTLKAGALSGPRGSFIELSKQMIDWLNCYFVSGDVMASNGVCSEDFDQGVLGASRFRHTAYSLHFYSQILLIEKAEVVAPKHYKSGGYSFAYGGPTTKWDGTHYAVPAVATAPVG